MKKTEKIKYELDPLNRLILSPGGKRSKLSKYRKILTGRIKIDKNNSLVYKVNTPQGSDVPTEVKLSGKWSLDDKHDLVFMLTGNKTQYSGDKLKIKGEITDAGHNRLTFSAKTGNSAKKTRIYTIDLGGRWQADKYNRLTFNVRKEHGRIDILTMTGKWDIGRNNRIVYMYEKADLIRKKRRTGTIKLKGHWEITEKYSILYVLNKRSGSQLDFKVSLGEPFKRGLRYEIGVGTVRSKKKITIFGKWRINRRSEIIFEIPYEKGKVRRIAFKAEYKCGDNCGLTFRLKNIIGKDLGIDIKFSKKLMKDQGELFLRAKLSEKEKHILAGYGWRW